MHDDELRERLADWVRPVAGLPVPDIQVLERRARRRRIARAAAAATITAAVAAVATGAVVLIATSLPVAVPPAASRSASPSGHQSRFLAGPLPTADAGPAAAPYIVTIASQVSPAPAIVLTAFTGREIAVVNSPVAGNGFQGVAAAGDDRTFVLAAQDSAAASVQFYELRLAPDGSQESLTRLLGLPVSSVPPFAISPDGSRLAYATSDGVTVVSLATGKSRSWTADGNTAAGSVRELSWAGDKMLAINWTGVAANSRQAGIRLLDTSAQGSDLLASRRIIPVPERTASGAFSALSGLLITPDGSKVFATAVSGLPDHPSAEVVEFSARTGRALAVVTPRADESGMGTSCLPLWTDPSGEQLTAECDSTGTIKNGTFTAARLHVPAVNFSTPGYTFIAW
jgi:hypothetical protein